ncbi:Predicted arabinose efflux permease, MFS family [Sphingopyxis sp. YR583]|uniref:MFS transporter n=1 Tax=Sphingopyxis sp. YR583 TaxID=1881047 RepID=UPI0008A7F73F|nr:MFS transporter [Sphingopyxis sp. YR583]SEH13924.1 Predicted arabinose efflux permease, MFS family [Sphingopyxis sp. YR583]
MALAGPALPTSSPDRAAGPAPSSAKAPVAAWYALAVLIGTTLFAFVDRQILNLVAPMLQKELGLSDVQLGMLHGLTFVLFASVASYPIGWLSDRYGRRIILAGCIMLWSASTALCAFQTSFTGLFIANAGIAIGEAALTPIVFSMIPDLFPERQRNTANFTFFAATLLGAAAGFGLGGVLLDWLASHHQTLPAALADMSGWRVALLLAAAPGPAFVLLLATIRIRPALTSAAADTHMEPELTRFLPFMKQHWRTFACIYGLIAAYGFALNSAFTWLPIAIPRVFGTASSTVGMELGGTVALATIAALLLPPVGARLLRGDDATKSLRLARIFLTAAIVPTPLLLVATTPWHVYASAGLQCMFGVATAALMPGILQQIAPAQLRSRLLSLLGIFSAISTGLAPVLVGALSSLLSETRGIFIAIVIVALPGWLLAALIVSAAKRPFVATMASIKNEETEQ